MKTAFLAFAVAAGLFLRIAQSHGEEATCDPGGTPAGQDRCAVETCSSAERELSELYDNILARHEGDEAFARNMGISQREWRKFTEAELRVTFHCGSDNGADCAGGHAVSDYYSYKAGLIKERTGRLRKLFPE